VAGSQHDAGPRARARHGHPARADADRLIRNYARLRRIEAILRRWSFEGETVLPTDPAPYYRVSVRCGCASADEFRQQVASARRAIRDVYTRVFRTPRESPSALVVSPPVNRRVSPRIVPRPRRV